MGSQITSAEIVNTAWFVDLRIVWPVLTGGNMPQHKRKLVLFGNTTSLSNYIENNKVVVRCKSNYYSPVYATELLIVLLGMLGKDTEVIFESDKYGLKPATLRTLIYSAWAYLIDHGPTLDSGVDWTAIKLLRQKVRIKTLDNGVCISAKYRATQSIPTPSVGSWNSTLREWLEGDMEKELIIDELNLTDDNLEMLDRILGNFEEIEYELCKEKIQVRKRVVA